MTLGSGHQNSLIFLLFVCLFSQSESEVYRRANEGRGFKVVKVSDPFICEMFTS